MDARKLLAHGNMEQYKKLAEDILKAFRSGDREALQCIKDQVLLERPLTRKEVRAGVQRRLHKLQNSRSRSRKFSLPEKLKWLMKTLLLRLNVIGLGDIELMIAWEYGFANWLNFAKHIEELNREGSPVSKFESAVTQPHLNGY